MCVYVCMFACMYVCVCIYIYIYISVCVCMYVYVFNLLANNKRYGLLIPSVRGEKGGGAPRVGQQSVAIGSGHSLCWRRGQGRWPEGGAPSQQLRLQR